MKIFLGVMLLLAVGIGTSYGSVRIGSCDSTWYYIEKSYCDTVFVKSMNGSSDPLKDCPTLYDKAHECFKVKILDECFKDDQQKHAKTIEFLEHEFGGGDHFCKYGLLPTMKAVMEDVDPNKCSNKNYNNYTKCEQPFREAFQEEFKEKGANFERLSNIYAKSKLCQSETAISCDLPRTEESIHFFDPLEFNPYDPIVMSRISDTAKKIELGEPIGKADTTYITIAIVGAVLLVALGGVFFFLWRRDRSRAEIRRRKSAAKQPQQNNGQPKQEADVEMQPLASAAVVQTSDEVSSA